MEDTQKPFACTMQGCTMRFNSQDNLTIHKRKHDMVLDLENDQKTNVFLADQTPTPTRFIRNCEEVGLFQDLQNVNPFDETFRKAVEASRVGGSHLEVDQLLVPAAADDTLHTPHVFPNITEEHSSIANLISSSAVTVETEPVEKSQSREELEPLQVSSILQTGSSITEDRTSSDLDTNIDISELEDSEVLVVKQEIDASQSSQTSTITRCKIPMSTAPVRDKVQLMIHMADGRLVQLSDVSMVGIPSTQIEVPPTIIQSATPTQTSTPSSVIFNNQLLQCTATSMQVPAGAQTSTAANATSGTSRHISTSSSTPDIINTSDARLSVAKMKLKQRIEINFKKKENIVSETEQKHTALRKVPGLRTLRAPSSESSDASSASPKGRKNSNTSTAVDEQKVRFRERNRAAAMRCREKRKLWLSDLEKRADDTLRVNQQLTAENARLRNELMQLKSLLLAHKACPITKAMQRGMGIAVFKEKTTRITQLTQSTISIPHMPIAISGSVNVCASLDEPAPKVVLLNKPAGLKRRRAAALAAGLTIVENGSLHTNDLEVEQSSATHVTVSQPMSIVPDSSQICSNQEDSESNVSDSVTTTQPTCFITVAAPTLIPAGISTQGIAVKPSSLTSTSYLVPTKTCLSNDSLPRVVKFNTNNLKSLASDTMKASTVTHASGDSMDSGHGSDIEILAEFPVKSEVKS